MFSCTWPVVLSWRYFCYRPNLLPVSLLGFIRLFRPPLLFLPYFYPIFCLFIFKAQAARPPRSLAILPTRLNPEIFSAFPDALSIAPITMLLLQPAGTSYESTPLSLDFSSIFDEPILSLLGLHCCHAAHLHLFLHLISAGASWYVLSKALASRVAAITVQPQQSKSSSLSELHSLHRANKLVCEFWSDTWIAYSGFCLTGWWQQILKMSDDAHALWKGVKQSDNRTQNCLLSC